MTLEEHQKRWSNCEACPLHKNRINVVTYRGDNPCDVLLIGEAPGRSEDFLGEPFVGESGYMLKEITDVAFKQHCRMGTLDEEYGKEFDFSFSPEVPLEAGIDKVVGGGGKLAEEFVSKVLHKYPDLRIGISNICCCLPLDEPEVEGGYRQIRPPEKSEAEACRGRLLELIRVVRPKAIVALGRVPGKFIPRLKDGLPPFVQFIEETIHPAALCRLQADDPIRFIESRNRCLLTLTRLKHRIYGLDV